MLLAGGEPEEAITVGGVGVEFSLLRGGWQSL